MKKIYLISILAIISLAFKSTEVHPIHISIGEVDYFTDRNEIQVGLKIFTDDLEASIRQGGVRLNLDSDKEIEKSAIYIEKYIKKNFELETNVENSIGRLKYVGKEYEEASTWVYFSFPIRSNSGINKIRIMNKVVMNLHDDQSNLINFRKDRKLIKTGTTNKKSKTMTVELK